MKMFKRVLAVGAALMMAVTGMAMSASAATTTQSWFVRRVVINGYISSESISSASNIYSPASGHPSYGVICKCSSFSSGTDENGHSLGVTCNVYRTASNGIIIESIDNHHFSHTGECLEIAKAHLEMLAAAGVSGLYVTHLNSLYADAKEINAKGYPTRIGSLVAGADELTGNRLYKLKERPPLKQSAASQIFEQYGAKLSEITNGQNPPYKNWE